MTLTDNSQCTQWRFLSLQDAFRLCSSSVLVCVIMNDHAYGSFPLEGPDTFRAVKQEVESLLEAMRRLEVSVPSKRDHYLLPDISYSVDARVGAIRRWVSASLFDVSGSVALSGEELEPLSYSAVSWERVLAWEVCMPRTLCKREAYMMLASAFWEMSFCLLEYAWVKKSLFGASGVSQNPLHEAANALPTSSSDTAAAKAGGSQEKAFGAVGASQRQDASKASYSEDELTSEMLFRASPTDVAGSLGYLRKLCAKAEIEKLNRSYFNLLAHDAEMLNKRARADSLRLRKELSLRVG